MSGVRTGGFLQKPHSQSNTARASSLSLTHYSLTQHNQTEWTSLKSKSLLSSNTASTPQLRPSYFSFLTSPIKSIFTSLLLDFNFALLYSDWFVWIRVVFSFHRQPLMPKPVLTSRPKAWFGFFFFSISISIFIFFLQIRKFQLLYSRFLCYFHCRFFLVTHCFVS